MRVQTHNPQLSKSFSGEGFKSAVLDYVRLESEKQELLLSTIYPSATHDLATGLDEICFHDSRDRVYRVGTNVAVETDI